MAKILIADDEPQVRALLMDIVKGEGHDAYEAYDGVSALYDTKDLKPDVLLLDWMIPELFGGEVIQRLRNTDEFADVKDTIVIVVSDFDDEASQQTFAGHGADDFVAKRDNPDEMKTQLLKCLNTYLRAGG